MAVVSRLLQQRHADCRALLAVDVIALVSLRGLQNAPRLVSVVYPMIVGIAVLLDSPLLPGNRLRPEMSERIPSKLLPRLKIALMRRQVLLVGWVVALLIEVGWVSQGRRARRTNPLPPLKLNTPRAEEPWHKAD